jgi:hypothetical protein
LGDDTIPLLTLTQNNHNKSAPLQASFQSSSRYIHKANPI